MDTPGTPTGQKCSPFGLRRRGAKHPGRARTTPRRERQPSLLRSPHASATEILPRSRSSLKALLCAGVNLGNQAPKGAASARKRCGGWFCLGLAGEAANRRGWVGQRRSTNSCTTCVPVPTARWLSGAGAEQPSLVMPASSEPPVCGSCQANQDTATATPCSGPLEEPGVSSQGQVGCT